MNVVGGSTSCDGVSSRGGGGGGRRRSRFVSDATS